MKDSGKDPRVQLSQASERICVSDPRRDARLQAIAAGECMDFTQEALDQSLTPTNEKEHSLGGMHNLYK